EVKLVLRNGVVEPWTARRVGDVLRITVGGPGYLPTPSDQTYILRYRTTRQIVEGGTSDRLSLDVLGSGYGVPVEQVTVNIALPRAVDVDALQTAAITGTPDAP